MGTVSYGVQLKGMTKCLDSTIRVYRDAVRYLVDIVFLHFGELDGLPAKEAQRHIECLVHGTKNHLARYPKFDSTFYRFPSYLRRSAITTAIGRVKSYKSLVTLWEQDGCQGKRPSMNFNQDIMPCFFRGNMFKEENGLFSLKVYQKKDWVWLPIRLRKTDLDYIKTNCLGLKESAPVLEKRNHGYSLRFAYEYSSKDTPRYLKDEDTSKVIGVDLGINTDAVCSTILRDGTVIGSHFIDSPVEKDRMYTLLNVIKGAQQHGSRRCLRLWRFVYNYNKSIAIHTAREIVRYAVSQKADIIVFEHLDMTGKKLSGSRKQKLSLWRKRDIQKRVEAMASRYGIHVTYICAKNTSRLAFDGSGEVVRDEKNHALCTFASGKRYNCDLSASKNIGARYFIRAVVNYSHLKSNDF